MPTRLRNIRIDEVSSVDKGAGLGVDVVLLKRDAGPKATPAEKALAKVFKSVLGDDADAATISVLTEAFKQFRDHEELDDMTIAVDKNDLTKLIGDLIAKALADAGVGIAKMTPEHAAYHQHLDGDEAKRFAAMGHDDRAKHVKAHPITSEHEAEGDNNDGESAADEEHEKRLIKAVTDLLKARTKKRPKGGEATGDGRESPDGEGDGAEKRLAKLEADAKKREGDLQKRIDALEGDKQKTEFAKRAIAMGLPEADGAKLLKAHKGDPEALKWLEDQYSALRKQVDAGTLFAEFGTIEKGTGGASAHDELVAKGAELRKADPKLTVEAAYVKAMEGNPDIAKRERAERSAALNGRRV